MLLGESQEVLERVRPTGMTKDGDHRIEAPTPQRLAEVVEAAATNESLTGPGAIAHKVHAP